jgi:hypothetical protein
MTLCEVLPPFCRHFFLVGIYVSENTTKDDSYNQPQIAVYTLHTYYELRLYSKQYKVNKEYKFF